ncbi:MAG: hypothetical protein KKA31_03190, partial [Candidatus Margulisbacteria bacterium]|nr:hypothetical protein [Candidatus Margulisiibacteriota bacterium]
MMVEADYEDLLKSFNKHKVKYCIVGAFALGFYARPRYTKDMDIFVEASKENGSKIIKALKDFGFGTLKLSSKDFTKKNQVIQLGYDPVRIDLLTSIEGCTFKEVWKHKKNGKYGKTKVYFIGLNDFKKN